MLFPGKSKKVDKSAVEHTVKKKRRRANRINLIAEDIDDVTALDEIEGVDLDRADKVDKLDVFSAEDRLEVPVGDLLCSTPSPGPVATQELLDLDLSTYTEQRLSEDLKEFDVVQGEEVALTSNLAILAAEFAEAEVEEADPFDEAFDQLAKESINKKTLEEIESDLYNDDLFDTSKADEVLRLASLTAVVNKQEVEVEFDTFDDKDPFDTTEYEHLTKDHEEDLEFEQLAKRDPHETIGGSGDIGIKIIFYGLSNLFLFFFLQTIVLYLRWGILNSLKLKSHLF